MVGVQISNSSVTIQNVNISLFSNSTATELLPVFIVNSSSVVTINNSSLALMNTGANAFNNSDIFIGANNNTVTVMNSTLTATAGGNPGNSVNGINLGSNGDVVNVSNSQVSVTNTTAGGVANALNNNGTSNSITFNNGTLAATATSPAISSGPSITINGSVCYLNGSQVICP